jgi:copper chaperone NosL
MKSIKSTAWLVTAGMLAGCQPVDLSRPPTVRFGEEACASCRMIISDERFAAALVRATGDALKFDDIGCLMQQEAGRASPDVAYWVRNFKGQGWLNAREARFVHAPTLVSPMGYGLAALPVGQSADDPAGRSLRFPELPGFLAEPPREPPSNSQDLGNADQEHVQ